MNPVDEYIRKQDESIRARLNAIRDTLRAALPDAIEKISYQMPTYWKGRNIIHFAVFKKHIGLYPGGEATAVFANRLTEYKTSKGTIQIRHDQELPLDLVAEIARWAYERYAK